MVERVAPGRIWFVDDVGPIKVPEAASALARPGWTINLMLGKRGQPWDVLEVGNVYPETLCSNVSSLVLTSHHACRDASHWAAKERRRRLARSRNSASSVISGPAVRATAT